MKNKEGYAELKAKIESKEQAIKKELNRKENTDTNYDLDEYFVYDSRKWRAGYFALTVIELIFFSYTIEYLWKDILVGWASLLQRIIFMDMELQIILNIIICLLTITLIFLPRLAILAAETKIKKVKKQNPHSKVPIGWFVIYWMVTIALLLPFYIFVIYDASYKIFYILLALVSTLFQLSIFFMKSSFQPANFYRSFFPTRGHIYKIKHFCRQHKKICNKAYIIISDEKYLEKNVKDAIRDVNFESYIENKQYINKLSDGTEKPLC